MKMGEYGGTGIRASVIGLGCNNFGIYQDVGQAIAVERKALDVGINFLDIAGEDGSGLKESLVAEALGPRRKEVIIARNSDKANCSVYLKTDYIDLYQVLVADPETPRQETFRALDDLIRQGKMRALGEAATFGTADDLDTSQAIAPANGLTSFATMEANCSILVRDAEKAIIQ
jgi:aryl-alcohol dehydrogenase-like predicted oxidoreductase